MKKVYKQISKSDNKQGKMLYTRIAMTVAVLGIGVLPLACGLKNRQEAGEAEAIQEDEGEVSEIKTEETALAAAPDEGTGEARENNSLDGEVIDLMLSDLPETFEPCGLAADGDELLVADSFSKKIWKVSSEGAEVYAGADSVTDIYDHPVGGYNDGAREEAMFGEPWAVTTFISGVAVSDVTNNALRYITENTVQSLNATSYVGNTSMSKTTYDYPTGLTTDSEGRLYVSDTHSDSVLRITGDGECHVFIKGIDSPMGLSWNSGYLYIAETGANRIVRVETTGDAEALAPANLEVVAGTGEVGDTDGKCDEATFSSPKGVLALTDGTVFVADTVNGKLRKIKDGEVTSIEVSDETSPELELTSPIGLCALGGKLYVADNFSRKIFVVVPE